MTGDLPLLVRPVHGRRPLLVAIVGAALLAGCASPAPRPADAAEAFWSGRLALQVQSEPVQAYHASFELSGRPESGQLRLVSPLGTTLAHIQWSPQGATLTQGGQVSLHASVEEMAANLGGAAIPVSALFDWLQGRATDIPGWEADLSARVDGRISARRTAPPPAASLRIILDP